MYNPHVDVEGHSWFEDPGNFADSAFFFCYSCAFKVVAEVAAFVLTVS